MKKRKVNLHLIESCNYRCRHCFAHFDKHNVLEPETWKTIIYNSVASGKVDSFNFAGGEPLLYPHLTSLAEYAKSLSCKCSVITNGSRINEEWIKNNASLFSTIGFSLDSFSPDILRKIGRCDKSGEVLGLDRIKEIFTLIKEYNPEIKIKVNTVVSAINKDENLGELIKKHDLPVDRWKILRMARFENECFSNTDITVTDDEYAEYISRNLAAFGIDAISNNVLYNTDTGMEIVCESNLNGTYIMIDAGGYLVDDTKNSSYVRVINCSDTPFSEGIKRLTFDSEIYEARYQKYFSFIT